MRKRTNNRKGNRGFTLVEVMAVAGIIGLMAAISVPGLQKARFTSQKQVCRSNLRLIEDAIDEVMMESNLVSTAQITAEMVGPYLKVGAIENLSWPLEVEPPSDEVIQASETNGLYVVMNGENVTTGR